jgi:hypothetical protein
MRNSQKNKKQRGSSSQSTVSSVFSNDCNNTLLSNMGAIFGSAKQRCTIG